ncbi:hypothetical protein Q3G72_012397 [Acer saccharum]|nr:hypothetical protein Q3G72_012397 [Acer saccharum]
MIKKWVSALASYTQSYSLRYRSVHSLWGFYLVSSVIEGHEKQKIQLKTLMVQTLSWLHGSPLLIIMLCLDEETKANDGTRKVILED